MRGGKEIWRFWKRNIEKRRERRVERERERERERESYWSHFRCEANQR